MSAWYQKQDLRHWVSTWIEANYGTATVVANMNREFRLSDQEIAEAYKRTGYSPCGGEFYKAKVDERRDADLPLRAIAAPDYVGWFLHKLFGGGAGYSVTGSTNFTHTFKPIQAGDYTLDSFTVIEGYKGGSEYWGYRGGLMVSGKLSGTRDGDTQLRCEGAIEFAGERTTVTGFTPPMCVAEDGYRFGDVVFSFGRYGQSAIAGLRPRSFEISIDNKVETREECDRSGLYIVGRDRGDRTEGFQVKFSVLGKKGDAVDQAFNEGDFVFWQMTAGHPTPNRALFARLLKGQIIAKTMGFSTSVNKTTHELTILGYGDETNATTISQTPIYATVQNGTADYAQAA